MAIQCRYIFIQPEYFDKSMNARDLLSQRDYVPFKPLYGSANDAKFKSDSKVAESFYQDYLLQQSDFYELEDKFLVMVERPDDPNHEPSMWQCGYELKLSIQKV